jgi:hypothetical protein
MDLGQIKITLRPECNGRFDCATTRNSGSGVFDAGRKCLLGIMSRKISVRANSADAAGEEKDIAKNFVPASTASAGE